MSMAKKTDEELMLMFQKGNAAAFNLLFTRYKAQIYAFLVRQCGNRDMAADLTQDVFAKLIRNAQTFKHQSKFSTWIYTVARNAAIDNARKARHRKHASLDDSPGDSGTPLGERVPNSDPEPDRQATARKLQIELAAAIEKLPEDQREVFLLREYHGMPFLEIAEVVDAKVGTVKSRMRYALENLRQELNQYEEYARTLS